jgi:hypothetical protein
MMPTETCRCWRWNHVWKIMYFILIWVQWNRSPCIYRKKNENQIRKVQGFTTSRPLDCSWINTSLALVFGYTKLHCEVMIGTLIELWSSTHRNSESCLSAILSSHSRLIDWRSNSTGDARSTRGDTTAGLDGDDMGGMTSATTCDCHVLPPTRPLPIQPLLLVPLLTLWCLPPLPDANPLYCSAATAIPIHGAIWDLHV